MPYLQLKISEKIKVDIFDPQTKSTRSISLKIISVDDKHASYQLYEARNFLTEESAAFLQFKSGVIPANVIAELKRPIRKAESYVILNSDVPMGVELIIPRLVNFCLIDPKSVARAVIVANKNNESKKAINQMTLSALMGITFAAAASAAPRPIAHIVTTPKPVVIANPPVAPNKASLSAAAAASSSATFSPSRQVHTQLAQQKRAAELLYTHFIYEEKIALLEGWNKSEPSRISFLKQYFTCQTQEEKDILFSDDTNAETLMAYLKNTLSDQSLETVDDAGVIVLENEGKVALDKFLKQQAHLTQLDERQRKKYLGTALRAHQNKILQDYAKYLFTHKDSNSLAHAVFPLATGAGKTVIFAKLCQITQAKTLVLVPTSELRNQTVQKFADFIGQGLRVTTRLEDIDNDSIDVIVSSYQKVFDGKIEVGGVKQELFRSINFKKVAHVIMDEGHNALGPEREKGIKYIMEQGCTISGWSATPMYGANKSLYQVLKLTSFEEAEKRKSDDPSTINSSPLRQNPIPTFTIRQAIEAGANTPVIAALALIDTGEHVKFSSSSGDDLNLKDMSGKINTPDNNKRIVSLYVNGKDKFGLPLRGEQGIAFCAGVEHAKDLAATFNSIDIEAIDPNKALRNNYFLQVAKEFIQNKFFEKKWLGTKPNWPLVLHYFETRLESEIAAGTLSECEYIEYTQGPFDLTITGEELSALKLRTDSEFKIAGAIFAPNAKQATSFGIQKLECDRLLKQFRAGGILMLTGADMLIEGFDHSDLSVVFNVRPTKSKKVKIQTSGRGVRLNPNNKAKYCRVIDVLWDGNVTNVEYFYDHLTKPTGEISFQCGTPDPAGYKQSLIAKNRPLAFADINLLTSINGPVPILAWDVSDADAKIILKKIDKKKAKRKTSSPQHVVPDNSTVVETVIPKGVLNGLSSLMQSFEEAATLLNKSYHLEHDEAMVDTTSDDAAPGSRKTKLSLSEKPALHAGQAQVDSSLDDVSANFLIAQANSQITRLENIFIFFEKTKSDKRSPEGVKRVKSPKAPSSTSSVKDINKLLSKYKSILRNITDARHASIIDSLKLNISHFQFTVQQELPDYKPTRDKSEVRTPKPVQDDDDYNSRITEILTQLDPNGTLTVFELLRAYEKETGKVDYVNFAGIIEQKIFAGVSFIGPRELALINSTDIDNSSILHIIFLIFKDFLIFCYKEKAVFLSLVKRVIKEIDFKFLTQKNNQGQMPLNNINIKFQVNSPVFIILYALYQRGMTLCTEDVTKLKAPEYFPTYNLFLDILKTRNWDMQSPEGYTLIHHLIELPQKLIDKILLTERFNPDIRNNRNETPLMIWIRTLSDCHTTRVERRVKNIILLLRSKPNLELQDNAGATAFHLLIKLVFSHTSSVARLIAHAPLDIKDKNGMTLESYVVEFISDSLRRATNVSYYSGIIQDYDFLFENLKKAGMNQEMFSVLSIKLKDSFNIHAQTIEQSIKTIHRRLKNDKDSNTSYEQVIQSYDLNYLETKLHLIFNISQALNNKIGIIPQTDLDFFSQTLASLTAKMNSLKQLAHDLRGKSVGNSTHIATSIQNSEDQQAKRPRLNTVNFGQYSSSSLERGADTYMASASAAAASSAPTMPHLYRDDAFNGPMSAASAASAGIPGQISHSPLPVAHAEGSAASATIDFYNYYTYQRPIDPFAPDSPYEPFSLLNDANTNVHPAHASAAAAAAFSAPQIPDATVNPDMTNDSDDYDSNSEEDNSSDESDEDNLDASDQDKNMSDSAATLSDDEAEEKQSGPSSAAAAAAASPLNASPHRLFKQSYQVDSSAVGDKRKRSPSSGN